MTDEGFIEPNPQYVPPEFLARLAATPSRDGASFDLVWEDE